MPVLNSQLNPRAESFRASAALMQGLVDDLNTKLALIAQGGGETARTPDVLEACGLELLWATGLGEGRASVSRIASNLKAPSLRPSVRAGAVSLRVPACHSGRGWVVTALPVAWNIPLGRHQVEGSSNHQAAGHWIIGTIHRR